MKVQNVFQKWDGQPKSYILIFLGLPSILVLLLGLWLTVAGFSPFSSWLVFLGIIMIIIGIIAGWASYTELKKTDKFF